MLTVRSAAQAFDAGISIADLRMRARARVPAFVMDFVDGGAGDEVALSRNSEALRRMHLLPRPLALGRPPVLACEIFGCQYAAPFGVAPLGLADLIWPGTDRGIAQAASKAQIPYVAATAASATIEHLVGSHCPDAWFQLYVGDDPRFVETMLARAAALGVRVLVLTVDAAAPGRRLRDLRNGLALPFALSSRNFLQCIRRPRWLSVTLRSGGPRFANYPAPAAGHSASAATWMTAQSRPLDWNVVQELRSRWSGKLVLKGILHPADAVRAAEIGVDGVVVSNHGGRQLDAAPASVSQLPDIRKAAPRKLAVIMDGGIRSGEDIVKALVAGADFVLLGRAFLYGAAALGPECGPSAVIELLKTEIANTLALLGAGSPREASA